MKTWSTVIGYYTDEALVTAAGDPPAYLDVYQARYYNWMYGYEYEGQWFGPKNVWKAAAGDDFDKPLII